MAICFFSSIFSYKGVKKGKKQLFTNVFLKSDHQLQASMFGHQVALFMPRPLYVGLDFASQCTNLGNLTRKGCIHFVEI